MASGMGEASALPGPGTAAVEMEFSRALALAEMMRRIGGASTMNDGGRPLHVPRGGPLGSRVAGNATPPMCASILHPQRGQAHSAAGTYVLKRETVGIALCNPSLTLEHLGRWR